MQTLSQVQKQEEWSAKIKRAVLQKARPTGNGASKAVNNKKNDHSWHQQTRWHVISRTHSSEYQPNFAPAVAETTVTIGGQYNCKIGYIVLSDIGKERGQPLVT